MRPFKGATACLNVPLAHAMEEMIITAEITTVIERVALFATGIIAMHDGVETLMGNKTTLLFPPVTKISDNEVLNDACRLMVGLGEYSVGFAALSASLEIH